MSKWGFASKELSKLFTGSASGVVPAELRARLNNGGGVVGPHGLEVIARPGHYYTFPIAERVPTMVVGHKEVQQYNVEWRIDERHDGYQPIWVTVATYPDGKVIEATHFSLLSATQEIESWGARAQGGKWVSAHEW